MEQCELCNKNNTNEYNDEGVPVCSACADNNCQLCLVNVAEMETCLGDYICMNCHVGLYDSAYEYMEEERGA